MTAGEISVENNHKIFEISANGESEQKKSNNELYCCFRSYLILGRCIGVVPIQGLLQKDFQNIRFRKCSIAAAVSMSIILFSVFGICIAGLWMCYVNKSNPSDIAWAGAPVGFNLVGVYIYTYFFRHAEDLIRLFEEWGKLNLNFNEEDTNLKKDMTRVATVVLTSCVLENAVLHLRLFPVFEQAEVVVHSFNMSKDASVFEQYYFRSYPYIGTFIPYNPYLAVILFVTNKLILYTWNYNDILIVLFSRALYFKFTSLNRYGLENALPEKHLNDRNFWEQLVCDHNDLKDLVNKFAEFLSPLVFFSYAINFYNICLSLHISLTPSGNNSIVAALYSIWSLTQFILRVLIVTISAARIHESAHGITRVYQKCPPKNYSQQVERSDRCLQYESVVGFHGLKCFYITRPLILSYLHVIMTFEVVLLQATGAPSSLS